MRIGPDPAAPSDAISSVPLVSVTPPLNVLAAASTTVPAPSMTSDPTAAGSVASSITLVIVSVSSATGPRSAGPESDNTPLPVANVAVVVAGAEDPSEVSASLSIRTSSTVETVNALVSSGASVITVPVAPSLVGPLEGEI